MLNYNWIANLDNKGLTTPFKVKYDNEYFPALKMMLEDLVNRFRIAGMEDTFVEAIDAYQKLLILLKNTTVGI